jgi:prophage regulatory protein
MTKLTQLQAAVAAAVESNRILRLSAVKDVTGLSRASIYRRMANHSFPRQVSLGGPGGRAVGWRERDIAAFIDGLKTAGEQ